MTVDPEPTRRSDDSPPSPRGDDSLPEIPEISLTEPIGRGGMGVVYRGRQEYLGRDVAVKLLIVDPNDRDYAARFQREAKILAGLSHPNIVSCYSAGITDDDKPYIVMEYIDGPNLRQWVDKCGAVTPNLGLRIIADIALALQHGYRSKIIHRDVKPENVLLARKVSAPVGTPFPYEVKLADLGLARSVLRDETMMNLTSSREVLGTPPLMAPEQFEDSSSIDHRCDIYALGCVLFHLLTGQFAYTGRSYAAIIAKKQEPRGPDPRNLNPDIPAPVADLVSELLSRDAEDRPQTYEVLIRRLEQLITQLETGIATPTAITGPNDGQTMVLEATSSEAGAKRAAEASGAREKSAPPKALFIGVGAVLVLAILGFVLFGGGPEYTIVGAREASEGSPIDLEIRGEGIENAQFGWSVTTSDGTPIETPTTGKRLRFDAPNRSADYTLNVVWWVKGMDESERVSDAALVAVRAANDPPVVSVPPEIEARSDEPVFVRATAHDPEGAPIARYHWRVVQPVSGVDLGATDGAGLRFEPPELPEAYSIELEVTATDEAGATSEPVRTVVAVPAAKGFDVDAGFDFEARAGATCTLQGVVEGGAGPPRTRWQQVDGPAVLIADQGSTTTTFKAPTRLLTKTATLVFELGVASRDRQARDQVRVTVRAEDRFSPLTSSAGQPLFARPLAEIMGDPDWTATGSYGFEKNGSEDVVTTGKSDEESRLTGELPRGEWRLAGALDDTAGLSSPQAHGIEIELVDRKGFVRFEVERENETRVLTITEVRLDAETELPVRTRRARERLSKDGLLHFRLEHRDGKLRFRFVDHPGRVYKGDSWDEVDLDASGWPDRTRPRLTLFVDGDGEGFFRNFRLSGLQ
ncbi:MAG: protein kinase [Planctomycetota bacterium]